MGLAVGMLSQSCLGAEKHAIKEYQPPSWIFPLPVWSHSIVMSPNGKLDFENIGIAVGISSPSCLGAQKYAIKECQPLSWILPLPVWSHSHVMSPNGKIDPKNIGIAVGISLISCLEAKIRAFEV